jgi:hypothetical protein
MKNPMQAVLEIFLLAVGVPCIIVLIAAENAIVTLIVMIYAVLLLYQLSCLRPIMCCYSYRVWSVRSRITLEWYDTCVGETENHPEAWWYNTAFEYYNVNLRALLSFSTCSNGYSQEHICIKRNGCLSVACPASMLMRAYRTGRYRHPLATAAGFRLLPNEKKSCRRTVTNNAMKCGAALYGDQRTINFIKLNGSLFEI